MTVSNEDRDQTWQLDQDALERVLHDIDRIRAAFIQDYVDRRDRHRGGESTAAELRTFEQVGSRVWDANYLTLAQLLKYRSSLVSHGWGPRPRVLGEVATERDAQDAKWGEQNHPDGTGPAIGPDGEDLAADEADAARIDCQLAFKAGRGTWHLVLREEVAEAFAESDPVKLRTELIQVAAVAVAWVEAIDRRGIEVSDGE